MQSNFVDEEEGKLRFEKSSLPKHFTYNPELGNLIIHVCKENNPTHLIMVSQNNRFEGCFEVKVSHGPVNHSTCIVYHKELSQFLIERWELFLSICTTGFWVMAFGLGIRVLSQHISENKHHIRRFGISYLLT